MFSFGISVVFQPKVSQVELIYIRNDKCDSPRGDNDSLVSEFGAEQEVVPLGVNKLARQLLNILGSVDLD